MHKVFTDGEDVCVIYDLNSSTPPGTKIVSAIL
jgi:hypothetical protein